MVMVRQIARCMRHLLVLSAALGTAGTAAGQSESRDARFEKEIVPILKQHCVQCHGAKLTRGGLDLSTAAGLVTGSDSGPVIVKGSADKSLLFEKIADQTMPPPEKKDRLSDEEIATLRKWLDDGAPGTEASGPLTKDKKDAVTDEDRAHWAFRKVVAGPVPPVQTTGRVRTPVDVFVLAKLQSQGLTFSPDAEKTTLLRRAYLDLVGLPPSREERQAYLADTSADAYERVVDRLLDSVHYGERWGRHWLDVAGYTDSPHCDKQGAFLPAEDWRYRDYVVRSFNDDKPYDRFLIEQLAGDEFVDWRSANRFTPEILDALIATGYLRTTPDWTHSDVFQEAYRYDTLARVVDNVATGVLGLTMNCARCHSHKYEPIPHEDYYRLMAVFATAYNTEDWLRPEQRFLADIPPSARAEIDAHNKNIDTRLEQIKKELDAVRAPHKKEVIAGRLAMLPEAIRADVETALNTALESRNEIQRYLASKFDSLTMVTDQQIKFTEAETASLTKLGNEFGSLQGQKKSYGKLQSLFDVGKPPALPQLNRGDSRTPGNVVEAGFPSVLCPPDKASAVRRPETPAGSSGRRLALARWLTSRDHPLTARVLVNRVWQHHFGVGIVATPENFGRSGSPPTHPELLDWLAADFMEHGWSIKRLHRQMMTSTAYRQSAHRPSAGKAIEIDPENELLSRMNLRRLEAEVLRDSVLAVSGKLDPTVGGAPIAVTSNPDGLVTISDKGPNPAGKWRRSIYVRSLRGSHPSGTGLRLSMLEVFDFPEVVINCTRRVNSTTPLQSLTLMNSPFMQEQSRSFAERVRGIAGDDRPALQIETAFVLAFGRTPSAREAEFCLDYLKEQQAEYQQAKPEPGKAPGGALAGLCSMLLASNEFLYNG